MVYKFHLCKPGENIYYIYLRLEHKKYESTRLSCYDQTMFRLKTLFERQAINRFNLLGTHIHISYEARFTRIHAPIYIGI